jgi:cytochrome P450
MPLLSKLVEHALVSPTLSVLAVSLALFLAFTCLHVFLDRQRSVNLPPTVRDNYPFTGPVGFWTERWTWYKRQRDQAPNGTFSFNVGPNKIIALSGEQGRRMFFESRHLGLTEGYAVLFGASPKLEMGAQKDPSNHFNRTVAYLLRPDTLNRRLTTLVSDVQEALEAIKNEPTGISDPFESIYRIVYRLTIRVVGAEEIANDPEILEESLRLFEFIEHSTTAVAVMFPKLPSPAVLKRMYGGARLFMLIKKIVQKRAASDEKHDDALQYMLDQGDDTMRIVEFIIGSLHAGILNSGINAAWVLCYLATSPEWLARVRDEVRSVAAKYAKDTSLSLRIQLDQVPREAWENEFPLIELCLRDSIRLNALGTAFRRNVSGQALPTGNGNEVIPPGAFVTYALGDVHQDPKIYPDPEAWNPGRYLSDDTKAMYPFLGWGVARHPCRKCCCAPSPAPTPCQTNSLLQPASGSPNSSRTSSPRTSCHRSTFTSRIRRATSSLSRPL